MARDGSSSLVQRAMTTNMSSGTASTALPSMRPQAVQDSPPIQTNTQKRQRVMSVSLWTLVGALCLQLSIHDIVYAPFHTATNVKISRRTAAEQLVTISTPSALKIQPRIIVRPNNTISTTNIAPISDHNNNIQNDTITITPEIPQRPRKIAFVHVGKAGGNTVRAAFPRLRCRRLQGPDEQARCFENHNRSDSPLSRACDVEIHLHTVGPHTRDELDPYTTFLVALRNPVTRALSAYQYLHPDNTQSSYARSRHPAKVHFYHHCFPTLPVFLQTLNQIQFVAASTSASHYSHCQRLAIQVLKGRDPMVKHMNIHLRDNYHYYYEHTLGFFDASSSKEVFVVRTEHLWEDMKNLDMALGGPGVFAQEGSVVNQNTNGRNTQTKRNNSNEMEATPQQLRSLCCLLWEELGIYQTFLERAVNLSYDRQWATLQEVWSTCSIDAKDVARYPLSPTQLSTNNQSRRLNFSWSEWNRQSCPDVSLALSDE